MKKLNLKWKITVISAIVIILISIISTFFLILIVNNFFESMTVSQVYFSDIGLTNLEIEKLEMKSIEMKKFIFISLNILVLFFTIIITASSIYLIVKNTMKPIEEISNEIKKIDSSNLDIRLSEDYSDDINEITIAFNNMAKQLQKSFAMQKQFAANASHEFKTPVGVILTNIEVNEILSDKNIEEYEKLIDIIKRNTIRVKDLIDQLLILANDNSIDKNAKIDLENMFYNIKNDVKFLCEKNNVNININGVKGEIKGNYNLLYIAFLNLVQNAIKYNNENGEVNISYTKNLENHIIYIEDNGIGIDESELENIFLPFYRSDKSRSRESGGSGLGLSIVKEILEKHKIEIEIESELSVGTKIKIKL